MFTLTIHTDNAAFQDDPSELANVLRQLAKQVDGLSVNRDANHALTADVFDTDGNRVGSFVLQGTE